MCAKSLTQAKAQAKQTTTREFDWVDGETVEITVRDATLDEIEAIEDEQDGEQASPDLVQKVFDDYVEEDLDASQMPMRNINLVMKQVFQAWGVAESELDTLIEDRQGN